MDPETTTAPGSSKIMLGIVIVLVIAAIAFAVMRTRDNSAGDSPRPQVFSGSLFELTAREGDWVCRWSSEQDDVELDGAVYVSGGRFKSSVDMSGAVDATMHAIGDGTYVHTWSTLMPQQGMRFAMGQMPTAPGATTTDAQGSQFTDDYSYECEPWTADERLFTLPSGVDFIDLSAITN